MFKFFNKTINISKLTVKKSCKETKNRKLELNFFDDVKENTLNEIFKNKNNKAKKKKCLILPSQKNIFFIYI